MRRVATRPPRGCQGGPIERGPAMLDLPGDEGTDGFRAAQFALGTQRLEAPGERRRAAREETVAELQRRERLERVSH